MAPSPPRRRTSVRLRLAASLVLLTSPMLSCCLSEGQEEDLIRHALGGVPPISYPERVYLNGRSLRLETTIHIDDTGAHDTARPTLRVKARLIGARGRKFPPGVVNVSSVGLSSSLLAWSAPLQPVHPPPDAPAHIRVFHAAAPAPDWRTPSVVDAFIFFETADGRRLAIRARNQPFPTAKIAALRSPGAVSDSVTR